MAAKMALAAAERSEDPYRKVGACAMNEEGRVIGVAYNGVMAGFDVGPHFWDDRNQRQLYMLHAEQNLCALVKRGELFAVAVTLQPCPDCAKLLVAHGVREVYYLEKYLKNGVDCASSDDSLRIFEFYGLKMEKITISDKS